MNNGATILGDSGHVEYYLRGKSPDSTQFLSLSPSGRELKHEIEKTVGMQARLFAYYHIFTFQNEIGLKLFKARCPKWQCFLLDHGLYSVLRFLMMRLLKISKSRSEGAWNRICTLFDETDALLKDGRDFLDGEEFTVLDISFCSLAAPLLLPAEYGGSLPTLEEVHEGYAEKVCIYIPALSSLFVFLTFVIFVSLVSCLPHHHSLSCPPSSQVEELRARPTGEYILKMYREQRYPSTLSF